MSKQTRPRGGHSHRHCYSKLDQGVVTPVQCLQPTENNDLTGNLKAIMGDPFIAIVFHRDVLG